MRTFFLLVLASFVACQQLPVNYNARSTAGDGAEMCPSTQDLVESIKQDIHSLINNSVLHALSQMQPVLNTGPGYGACGCGGHGWKRAAYLNMSDPTQTCPPAWELITTPRRTCARPSSAGTYSCYSAMFPTQGIQYSQVCGRIIGYQVGQPEAFVASGGRTIDGYYVDGVSLTYGSPRQHIWTFANSLHDFPYHHTSQCPCTAAEQYNVQINLPSFIGGDYFCESGVPSGQSFDSHTFHANDPLWDGQDCGSISASTCECTFNNPPWFCKQIPQSTNVDLEIRLCSKDDANYENTPIELIEIYIK